tara:strand:- start:97 stop:372 length:276 start_codon:yes stop_codon:yes gene_type:complete
MNMAWFDSVRRLDMDQVCLMLKKGQDVNVCDKDGFTSLGIAMGLDDKRMVRLLLDHDALLTYRMLSEYKGVYCKKMLMDHMDLLIIIRYLS